MDHTCSSCRYCVYHRCGSGTHLHHSDIVRCCRGGLGHGGTSTLKLGHNFHEDLRGLKVGSVAMVQRQCTTTSEGQQAQLSSIGNTASDMGIPPLVCYLVLSIWGKLMTPFWLGTTSTNTQRVWIGQEASSGTRGVDTPNTTFYK